MELLKARDVFEICHDRYRECRGGDGKVNAINPAASANSAAHKASALPRVAEYIIDFEIAGMRALRKKHRNADPQVALFRVFYLQAMSYEEVKAYMDRFHKTKPGTVDVWAHRMKGTIGAELARAGLYPPAAYFREPTTVQKQKREEYLLERFQQDRDQQHD